MKKKKSQFNLHNDGNVSVILSLKELLNVSSDWMDIKSKGLQSNSGANGSSNTGASTGQANVPTDF